MKSLQKENELIKAIGVYAGHSAKGNFNIELKAIFTEEFVMDAIQFIAGIGRRLLLIAVVKDEKIKLGEWTVYNLKVDKNMQATITFKSNKDAANMGNMNRLLAEDEVITFVAKLI